MTTGLRIPRRYTSEGADPYSTIEWARRDSRITNPDGSVVFEVLDAEVPASWSQVATDIVVSKYFRKAGVPQTDADGKPVLDGDGNPVLGSETSGRQVFDRLATTWRYWGEKHGYFASSGDAQAYEDEMKYMLANQIASPNSPQWFNTGLAHAYGITGTPQGFWYVDPETGEMTESPDSYTHPAPHACFPAGTLIMTRDGDKKIEDIVVGDFVVTHESRIRPVVDVMRREVDESLITLVSEIGTLVATSNHPIRVRREDGDVWKDASNVADGDFVVIGDGSMREIVSIGAMPFVGTVYNFQVEEDQSYVANGVVVHNCFINGVNDDLVNPGGIMDLWVREARLFKMGSGTGSNFSQIRAENETLSGGGKSSGVMGFLRIGDRAAGAIKSGGTTRRAAKMVILDLDHPDIEEFIDWKMHEEEKARILINHGGYAADFNGEAYATVSGQNSNNSVRVPNEFIEAVRNDDDWQLRERTSGKVRKTIKARDLWRKVAEAAWACADPGVQFDTIINEWHTSPAGGKIRATNPCFTGDTRIATDKGLIQFKDMVNRVTEGESFQVYTHDATGEQPAETISLTTATQVMITGKNQILRLEFSDGRVLRLTPNHRLWTANRGWVRADELTETDHVRLLDQEIDFGMASMSIPVSTEVTSYLARKSSRKNPVQLPEKWTEDFAHYLGWLIGDGSLTSETAVTVYGSKEEQQTVMFQHLDLLTQINGGIAPKPTKMGNGTYQLRLARLSFMRFLEALGVSTGLAGDKKVPWSIFEAPKQIVAAFLKGLYDADGCVRYGDTTRYVGLGSKSVELLQGVQQLLDTFGIHGSIYNLRASSKSVFTYTTKNGEQREYRGGAFSDLRIMGSDLERFWKSIGFWLSNKNDILEQVLFETTRYATRHWVKLRARTEDGWETTYNLTEPKNHSYLALGIIVSNCAEYVFLDNTACNLASINLVKFFDDDTNVFDTQGYEHAIRLWTITLEISVAMAHFPSREIAQGSYDYRTLGLGYANLGTLLMRMGLPYDSDAGRAVSGAITAILTGYSYATSAELSGAVGPFPRFAENREAMLRVIRNHRRAAYNTHQNEYEGLSHFVMGINPDLTPSNLLTAARQSWDLALDMGERHGFRNAQVTVIAPTGCLVGGSLVPTERGLVRLGTLGDPRGSQWQDLGIKVGTDEGAKTASQFYVNGVEPVVTVDTARGYRIQGTPTHRIKVVQADGSWVWKRLAEIARSDVVQMQMNQLVGNPHEVDLGKEFGQLNSDWAELFGYYSQFGLAEFESRVVFEIPHRRLEARAQIELLVKRLMSLDSTSESDTSCLIFENPSLSRLLSDTGNSGRRGLSDAVLGTNSRSIYEAYLSSFMEQGHIYVEDSSFAREIQTLLLALGYTSRIFQPRSERDTPNPRLGEDSYSLWEVYMPTDDWERFVSGEPLTDSTFSDRVVSAELGEEQFTYDLSVPENVTYVANGFVSHNTIGLQMDCDTTGVEPDFSLVKFKKLAGGGYFKIVNQSVTPALENLGYTDGQIEDIIRFIVGTSSLVGAPNINRESLMEKGFTDEDMARIEATLPAVFELRHAFNPFVLGEATMQRLGFEVDEYATFEFDLLRALGFTGREIWEATEWVCGQQTIEGAPHLKDDHLAVFDTANRNGRNGQRLIHHTGHIRMLAATQPMLSGAASKTINMPNEATIEDIEESYMLSFELGVKCMALYRDGSKASQPLSSSSDDAQAADEPEEVTRAHEIDKQILWGKIPVGMSPTQAYAQGMHPPRFLLPPRRGGYTQEAKIGGHKVYLRTGEYEDGTLGEVFIDLAKEGATLRGILSCFAIAVSKGLQFGVPLEEFVDTFTFQTFEPRGLVEGHPNIKMANSIVDYVFRALAVEYLKRDDLAQVPPSRDGELPEPASGLAVEAGIQLDLTDAVAEQHVAAVASAVKFLESRPVAPAEKRASAMAVAAVKSKDAGTMAMQSALGEMMGDAPLCDTCGHITIRNGSCYKCLNCGNSLGCS
ncbi:MAG TPA: LAGLIDADG family homing endonuclease [Acidimicrobiia bacterium]|nr:LAGLIDADG family homing endonuclease [Acidimicrobiia bacterium]